MLWFITHTMLNAASHASFECDAALDVGQICGFRVGYHRYQGCMQGNGKEFFDV